MTDSTVADTDRPRHVLFAPNHFVPRITSQRVILHQENRTFAAGHTLSDIAIGVMRGLKVEV